MAIKVILLFYIGMANAIEIISPRTIDELTIHHPCIANHTINLTNVACRLATAEPCQRMNNGDGVRRGRQRRDGMRDSTDAGLSSVT